MNAPGVRGSVTLTLVGFFVNDIYRGMKLTGAREVKNKKG